jgi:hypothetical protein
VGHLWVGEITGTPLCVCVCVCVCVCDSVQDMDNTLGQPNYPEFYDHRHDQAIFSLLTKK